MMTSKVFWIWLTFTSWLLRLRRDAEIAWSSFKWKRKWNASVDRHERWVRETWQARMLEGDVSPRRRRAQDEVFRKLVDDLPDHVFDQTTMVKAVPRGGDSVNGWIVALYNERGESQGFLSTIKGYEVFDNPIAAQIAGMEFLQRFRVVAGSRVK